MSHDVYVASSHRNPHLDEVHADLRAVGISTFDFRQHGPWWQSIAEADKADLATFIETPEAIRVFDENRRAILVAQVVLVIRPCGISTALEAGWAAGSGKPVLVWGDGREGESLDTMWRFVLAQTRLHGGRIFAKDQPFDAVIDHLELKFRLGKAG